jgi:hypothetical protein
MDSKVPSGLFTELQRLRAYIYSTSSEICEQGTLIAALDAVHTLLTWVKDNETCLECGTVFAWHFMAGKQTVSMIRRRHPVALVLLAYYCVALRCVEDYWFLQGWAKDLFNAIKNALPLGFQPWIELPRTLIVMETSIESPIVDA